MRTTATRAIYKAALQDKNIIFITGDLGHTFAKDYRENIPAQYINVGLAEQNMVGLAAGLALSGKKVFVFSIVPFAVMRCFEQIRIDICYQNLDVTIVGIGAGLAYSTSGCTHHAIEDIAIMRALPNMKIYSPCHPLEAELLAEKILKVGGPAYLRLGKGKEEPIQSLATEKAEDVETKPGIVIESGWDLVIFSTGHIVTEALSVASELKKSGPSIEVVHMHQLKPLGKNFILSCIANKKAVFTLEEHNIFGGLGSMVAEVISEANFSKPPYFKRFGIPDRFTHLVGSVQTLRKDNEIDNENLIQGILRIWANIV